MDALAAFLVNQPLHVLLVTSVYFLLWLAVRLFSAGVVPHPNAFLVPAVFALIYAGWEWLVTVKTPEANIRVDLILIWPLQAILTLWALIKTFLR